MAAEQSRGSSRAGCLTSMSPTRLELGVAGDGWSATLSASAGEILGSDSRAAIAHGGFTDETGTRFVQSAPGPDCDPAQNLRLSQPEGSPRIGSAGIMDLGVPMGFAHTSAPSVWSLRGKRISVGKLCLYEGLSIPTETLTASLYSSFICFNACLNQIYSLLHT